MKLTFKDRSVLGGDVNKFVFTPDKPTDWKPGQFIHYTLPHENTDDRGDERWFTVSSAPFEKDIWIVTRINAERPSSFKRKLLGLKSGDTIETGSPEGSFTIDDPSRDYIFVVGGIGITPLRSIVNQLHHDGKDINIELLYANRDAANIPFKGELEAISQKHPNFNIEYFVGDRKIDEATLREYGRKLSDPVYYVSGPEPMVEAFEATLNQMGIDENHKKFDYFPGYDA